MSWRKVAISILAIMELLAAAVSLLVLRSSHAFSRLYNILCTMDLAICNSRCLVHLGTFCEIFAQICWNESAGGDFEQMGPKAVQTDLLGWIASAFLPRIVSSLLYVVSSLTRQKKLFVIDWFWRRLGHFFVENAFVVFCGPAWESEVYYFKLKQIPKPSKYLSAW